MLCGECGAGLNDEAKFCDQCGAKIAAPPPAAPPSPPLDPEISAGNGKRGNAFTDIGRGLLIGGGTVGVLILLGMYLMPDDPHPSREVPDPPRQSGANRPSPAPAQPPKPVDCSPGDICRLLNDVQIISGVAWVPTATSIRAYDDFKRSLHLPCPRCLRRQSQQ
jgi:hypothetical protein